MSTERLLLCQTVIDGHPSASTDAFIGYERAKLAECKLFGKINGFLRSAGVALGQTFIAEAGITAIRLRFVTQTELYYSNMMES